MVYGNRNHYSWLGNCQQFDLMIFPSLYHYKSACPKPGEVSTPVILLPSEALGGSVGDGTRMSAKYLGTVPDENRAWSERIAAFCLWGSSHVRTFETYAPHLLPKCHVVGHPRFDKRCFPGQPLSYLSSRARMRLGFITHAVGLNPFDGRGMLKHVYGGRKDLSNPHHIYALAHDKILRIESI